jgi:hypothetical protein
MTTHGNPSFPSDQEGSLGMVSNKRAFKISFAKMVIYLCLTHRRFVCRFEECRFQGFARSSQRFTASNREGERVRSLWDFEAENSFEVMSALTLFTHIPLQYFVSLFLIFRMLTIFFFRQLSFPASAIITVLERIPGFIRGRYLSHEGWFQVGCQKVCFREIILFEKLPSEKKTAIG